jgi:hypothetical protein
VGDGTIHRYVYVAPHAKRKGMVELIGSIFPASDGYKAVLTWQICDQGETPLDDEPIEFSFDKNTIYWNRVIVKLDPSHSIDNDLVKMKAGIIGSGDKFIINGKDWGPWRKYLFIDEDGITVLSISRDHGIVEWIEYANEKDYKNGDCVRKFILSKATKKKMDIGSLKIH